MTCSGTCVPEGGFSLRLLIARWRTAWRSLGDFLPRPERTWSWRTTFGAFDLFATRRKSTLTASRGRSISLRDILAARTVSSSFTFGLVRAGGASRTMAG